MPGVCVHLYVWCSVYSAHVWAKWRTAELQCLGCNFHTKYWWRQRGNWSNICFLRFTLESEAALNTNKTKKQEVGLFWQLLFATTSWHNISAFPCTEGGTQLGDATMATRWDCISLFVHWNDFFSMATRFDDQDWHNLTKLLGICLFQIRAKLRRWYFRNELLEICWWQNDKTTRFVLFQIFENAQKIRDLLKCIFCFGYISKRKKTSWYWVIIFIS